MLKNSSSEFKNRIHRLHNPSEDVPHGRHVAGEGPTPATRRGLPNPNAIGKNPTAAEASSSSPSWLFTFSLEGFFLQGSFLQGLALYGATPYLEGLLCFDDVSANEQVPRPSAAPVAASLAGPELGAAVGSSLLDPNRRILSLAAAAGWLWERWRREREIRRAVDALAKLDDRTLRDIGIPDRSQIDRVVRFCRDC
jgi:uncharacterized protein YjiS (DUF1127 family)